MEEKKSMRVVSQNVRSLGKNVNLLRYMAEKEQPDILCVQETWSVTGSFFINGYQKPCFIERKEKRGGGVAVWVKKNIKVESYDLSKFTENKYEVIITYLNNNSAILNIYRPPSGIFSEFLEALKADLIFLTQHNKHILVVGDINLNWNSDSQNRNKLEDLLDDFTLQQKVTQPTRILSKTLIDHIYAGPDLRVQTKVKNYGISDHLTIIADCKTQVSLTLLDNLPKITYKYTAERIRSITNELRQIDWYQELGTEVDKAANVLGMTLQNLADKHCKVVTTSHTRKIKISKPLRNIKSRMNAALSAVRADPDNAGLMTAYKALKNKFRSGLKKEREKELTKSLQEKNSKKLWHNIRTATENEREKERENVELHNTTVSQVGETFNSFFQNVATEISNSIVRNRGREKT